MNKTEQALVLLKQMASESDAELAKLWDEITLNFTYKSEKLVDLSEHMISHAKDHNLNPAKRIRAVFMRQGYKLLGGEDDKSMLEASNSIELIQTALLMHDDVMDRDSMRRGKPTTHEVYKKYHNENSFTGDDTHYGYGMALVLGDICLTLGYKIMNEAKFDPELRAKALSFLMQGIINTGYGQAYDVTLEASNGIVEEEVITLHAAKTAIYSCEVPLGVGVLLAGGSNEDLELVSEYALPLGIAFQIQDDILGLFGEEEKTGKSSYADLKEGKKTLLILKALEKANNNDVEIIKNAWGNDKITKQDAESVREIVKKSGSLKHSQEIAEKYMKKSMEAIEKMRDKNWNKEIIDFLEGIADYLGSSRDF